MADIEHIEGLERELAFAAMIIGNELSILLTCVRLSYPDGPAGTHLSRARASQTLFFLFLLAGKLNEAWVLLKEHFLGQPEFESLLLRLNSRSRRALRALEAYFAKSGKPIPRMRNNLAFHYDYKVLTAALKRLPGDETIELWITPKFATSRNGLGSVIATRELRRVFSKDFASGKLKVDGLKLFFDDVVDVTGRFERFLDGVLVCALSQGVPLKKDLLEVDCASDPGIPAFLPSDPVTGT